MYVVDVSNIQSETMMNIIIYRRRFSLFDVRDVYKNEIIHSNERKTLCVNLYPSKLVLANGLTFPGAQERDSSKERH